MTRKEFEEILNYELYKENKYSLINKIRIKYFQPNTNCIFMARKMWYLYSRGGVKRYFAKLLYLKIWKRYGCCIYPNAIVGRGFFITHPVGIVLGKCIVGENFSMYQGCTIGVRRYGEESQDLIPKIGNNVWLYTNSIICGDVTIADNVTIGANSIVLKSILEPGTYTGSPARRVK